MKGLDALLGIIAQIVRFILSGIKQKQQEQRQGDLQREADAIRADTDAAMRDLGWLSDGEGGVRDILRPDGAPADYVPGASGGLSDPNGRGVLHPPKRHG